MRFYCPIDFLARFAMPNSENGYLIDAPRAPPPSQRQSDFSIDFLLNRAGSDVGCRRVEECEECPTGGGNRLCGGVETNFDWLQYTRYHPPRIQRPHRAAPAKRTPGRLPRIPFTPTQLATLEDAYNTATYLSSEEAIKLAKELDLTCTRVKIWFQNRRARERREIKTPATTTNKSNSEYCIKIKDENSLN